MNSLLLLEKRLKQIHSVLNVEKSIFPQIVLIGCQGAGKTSVLENIIGIRLFPRGATRCPVFVHLKNTERGTMRFKIGNMMYGDVYDAQSAFQQEMEMNGISQNSSAFSTKPIHVEVCGPNFLELTFVDLPGFCQVMCGDQPNSAENKLIALSLRYVKDTASVVLAVAPAADDQAINFNLQFLRGVHAVESRTIIVATKLDTAVTEATLMPLLNGKKFAGFSKTVGVISKHSTEKRKVEDSLRKEKKILSSKWPNIAREHGFKSLIASISNLLCNHIKHNFSHYRSSLVVAVNQTEETLSALGVPAVNSNRRIIQEVSRYSSIFHLLLNGKSWDIDLKSLVGGSRISYVFREVFCPAINALQPLQDLNRSEMLTALRNSSGTRPQILFIPEVCFESLARRQVSILASSCRECVDWIIDEMLQLSRDATDPLMLQRFPFLYQFIFKATADLIQRRRDTCCQLVEDLLTMQLEHINTLDFEFQREVDAAKTKWLTGRGYLEGNKEDDGNNIESAPNWFSALLRKEAGESTKKFGISRACSYEETDCQILESLLTSYFNIVRRFLQDAVPKAIMLRLVNFVDTNLYATLLDEFHKANLNQDRLLMEPDSVVQQRGDLKTFLAKLKNIQGDLCEIQEQLRNPVT